MFGDYIKEQDFGLSIYGHIPLENYQLQPPQSQQQGKKKFSKRGRPLKKNNLKKKQLKSVQNVDGTKNIGHWSFDQKRKYHWFLEIYNNHFLNKHLRRSDKIFKTMQSFIGTREAQQCRSHHQKIQKKYKTFHSILLNLRNENYGTQDHLAVEEDMINNKIQILGQLVKREQLYLPTVKKEQNSGQQMEIMQLKQESKAHQNMFSDRFEFNMDFHNILGERYFFLKQQ